MSLGDAPGEWIDHLLLVLGHFLWQGFAIGALAWLALALLKPRYARIRYAALLAALVAMPLSVAVTWRLAGPSPSTAHSQAVVGEPETAFIDVEFLRQRYPHLTPSAAQGDLKYARWACAGLYALGVLVMLARMTASMVDSRRLYRSSLPIDDSELSRLLCEQADNIGLKAAPAMRSCHKTVTPSVVGLMRPVILLPVSMASEAAASDLKAVLTHELAHIRRRDAVVNALQWAIETALFFHPVVWLVNQQLEMERERCCDDLVVRSGITAKQYAQTLVRIADMSLQLFVCEETKDANAALAATGNPSDLGRRVKRLLGYPSPRHVYRGKGTIVASVLAFAGMSVFLLYSMGGGASAAQVSRSSPNQGHGPDQEQQTKRRSPTAEVTPSDAKRDPVRKQKSRDWRTSAESPDPGQKVDAQQASAASAGPTNSHRQVYTQTEDATPSASWTSVFQTIGPGNQVSHMAIARVTVGGRFPVRLAGQDGAEFYVKLTSADDERLSVELTFDDVQFEDKGEAINASRIVVSQTLKRDGFSWVPFFGKKFSMAYASNYVDAGQPKTTNKATIVVGYYPQSDRVVNTTK